MCRLHGVTGLHEHICQSHPTDKGRNKDKIKFVLLFHPNCGKISIHLSNSMYYQDKFKLYNLVFNLQLHEYYILGSQLSKKHWGDESFALLEHIIFSSYQYWSWGVNYECSCGSLIHRADNGGGEIKRGRGHRRDHTSGIFTARAHFLNGLAG